MIDALIAQCAVADAPPAIIREIIEIESVSQPLAINVNGRKAVRFDKPKTIEQAGALVERLLALGHNIDMGYMQVNSQHLERFDMTPAAMFDPCTNIAIGSEIFMRAYRPVTQFYGQTPLALKTALSAYNTGTFHRGFVNGYVDRYGEPPSLEQVDKEPEVAPEPSSGDPIPTPPSNAVEDTDPYRSSTRVEVTFGTADF